MLRGVDTILALADEKTVIIPGHGPISNKIELQDYRDMLAGVQAKLLPMKRAGKTLEDVRKTNPLDAYNAQWGDGFLPAEKWLGIVYDSLVLK